MFHAFKLVVHSKLLVSALRIASTSFLSKKSPRPAPKYIKTAKAEASSTSYHCSEAKSRRVCMDFGAWEKKLGLCVIFCLAQSLVKLIARWTRILSGMVDGVLENVRSVENPTVCYSFLFLFVNF